MSTLDEREFQMAARIAQLEAELAEVKAKLLCKEGSAELDLWRAGGIIHDNHAQAYDVLAIQCQQLKNQLEKINGTVLEQS